MTVDANWLRPDFRPASMYVSPFLEMPCRPRFQNVLDAVDQTLPPFDGTLDEFARELLDAVHWQLARIEGPIHCMLSGGYDSRIIARFLEDFDNSTLYITDGTQGQPFEDTVQALGIPESRIYRHDLSGHDPYRLANATCDGWAPLYSQLDFCPEDRMDATLVTGLGGGEWFSYPASGWHDRKRPRIFSERGGISPLSTHGSVVDAWIDCWPQYALLVDAWARGYKDAVYPYCSPEYAKVANLCRAEWLTETPGRPELDSVRNAMLDALDPELTKIPWAPHRYDFRLSITNKVKIDQRFRDSWLAQRFELDVHPSLMHEDDYACTLGGFATWCDSLIQEGYELV